MSKYHVTLLETDRVTYEVEADNEQEATAKVRADVGLWPEIGRHWWGLSGEPEVELVTGGEA